MADETLSVAITADVGDFKSGVDSASSSIDELSGKCRQAQGSTSGLGGSTDSLRGKFSALTGVVAGVAQEIAGRLLSAVGDLVGEMVSASDSAQKFASTLEFAGIDSSTIDELTASTQKYADQTVYDLADIRNVTAQLAASGVDNYAQLAEAAGNLNAVAGGSASTFQSVAQVMTQTAGAGKLTTENWNQLTDAIPGASGALQDAMRDAGAFEGNFREAMENGEISAEEFNAAVMKLGMTDVAKEAATSTATIEGAVGNLQASVVGVGASLIDAFKPFITGGISQAATAISGIGTAIQTVSAYAGDWNGKLAEMSQEMGTSATNGDLVSAMVQDIGSQFGLSAAQTAPFANALGQIVDTAQPMVETLGSGLSSTVATLAESFGQLAAAAQPVIGALGSGIGSVASSLVGYVQVLFDWWSMLAEQFADFGTAVAPVVASAIGTISGILSTVIGVLGQVTAFLTPIIAQVISFVTGTILPIVIPAIQAVLNAVNAAMPMIQAVITAALTVIQAIWNVVWPAIQTVATTVFTTISNVIQAAMGVIQAIISTVMAVINGDWGAVWEGIGNIISSVWNFIVTYVTGVINNVLSIISSVLSVIKSVWDAAWNTISSFLSGIWETMKSTVSGAIDGVIQFFADLPGNILSALGDLGGLLVSAGGDLIDGLINGIKGAAGAVGDVLLGIVDNAVGGVLSFLGIASPSKLMAEIGGYTVEGFTVGVDKQALSAMHEVRRGFEGIVGGAETALASMSPRGYSIAYAGAEGASGGTTNVFNISIDGHSVGADSELMAALEAYAARVRQRGGMKARR